MRLSLDTLDGMQEHDIPTPLVKEFLHSVLNTNHWKNAPEVIQERALRFRKAVAEQKRPIAKGEKPVS